VVAFGVTRVTIVPRPLALMLVVLSLFALVGIGCGVMLIAFFKTAVAIVLGIAFVLVALRLGLWTIGQWRAIREIDVADDGAWTLADNLGRTFRVPADRELAVELLAYVKYVYRPLPVKLQQTAGRIVTPDRTWLLATNARSTYERVLRELGLGDTVPSDGLARYERRRAA
jgi:hypothetical protein